MLNKENQKELYEIFTNLIKIDSSNPPGNEKEVALYIKEVFKKDGIESEIYEKEDGRSNIYAEIGEGEEAILLLSHIDVVPGDGDWKYPPFSAHNDNGIIYGRGALDTKHLTAMEILTMLLIKRSGKKLNKKIKFLATADEEAGSKYGMEYIMDEHPHLGEAQYVISEGGGFVIEQEGKFFRTITCGEKGSLEMELNCKEEESIFDVRKTLGGKLFNSLLSLSSYEPEEVITPPTKMFKEATEGNIKDQTLKNLWQYSTKASLVVKAYEYINNGEKEITIPLSYSFLHGTKREDMEELINSYISDENGTIKFLELSEGYENSMDNEFVAKLDEVSKRLDSETNLLPMIALGRTDGRFIKKNVFGYSPMLKDIPFSKVLQKVHGLDECISEDSLNFGANVIYTTICELVY